MLVRIIPPFLSPYHCSQAIRDLLKCSSESVVWLFRAFSLAARPVLLHGPAPTSSNNGNSSMHALLHLTSLPSPILIPLDAPSVSSPSTVWSTQCKLG